MKLRIGISPCPNDTFIFEAIVAQKHIVKDISFEFVFEDVQTLNEMASAGGLDIIKISYAHYFSVMDSYIMLRAGGAMGMGVGPLLISKKKISPQELIAGTVAIPGTNTTANLLLRIAFPDIKNIRTYRFEKIEQAVLNEETIAGVIIHENRFTYLEKGLLKMADLGEMWEKQTGFPIPLGGIAIRRALPHLLQQTVNNVIRQSIETAYQNKPLLTAFIKEKAQEMNEDVMKKHIELYVNSHSLDIGLLGEQAVQYMGSVLYPGNTQKLFIEL
nr:1,4-dihydroxy-6-naphthoate synthase [Chitinophagaceae bacterium]